MWVPIGALLTLACTKAVYYTVAGQENDPTPESNVRIVAARTDDGRVEFALQQQQTDSSWSERQLPERRFFPTTGEWLETSAVPLPPVEAVNSGQHEQQDPSPAPPSPLPPSTNPGSGSQGCRGSRNLAQV